VNIQEIKPDVKCHKCGKATFVLSAKCHDTGMLWFRFICEPCGVLIEKLFKDLGEEAPQEEEA
jgi:predicted RNA-binding Zn-ribbon protein involved in translation (DUF1610 family)